MCWTCRTCQRQRLYVLFGSLLYVALYYLFIISTETQAFTKAHPFIQLFHFASYPTNYFVGMTRWLEYLEQQRIQEQCPCAVNREQV